MAVPVHNVLLLLSFILVLVVFFQLADYMTCNDYVVSFNIFKTGQP